MFHPKFWDVPLRLNRRCWGSEEQRPQPKYFCNYFLSHGRDARCINITGGPWTDGRMNKRMDGQLTVTIQRFAQCAIERQKITLAKSIQSNTRKARSVTYAFWPLHQLRPLLLLHIFCLHCVRCVLACVLLLRRLHQRSEYVKALRCVRCVWWKHNARNVRMQCTQERM